MDRFVRAYIVCALWSSTDNGFLGKDHPDNSPEGESNGGDPLDKNFSVDDLPEETIKAMTEDCDRFRAKVVAGPGFGPWDDDQAGHDFWLTRNGHGAGFWDRGHGAIVGALTDLAESFGGCDLYVGDDGKVYVQ